MELPALLLALFYFSTRNVFCDVSELYATYALEEDRVCSYNLRIKEIVLGRGERSGLIVTTKNYFKNWTGDFPFDCKFTVMTSFTGMGFFAVLQRMSLRKKHDGCLDYVQFRKVTRNKVVSAIGLDFKRDNSWEEEMCGDFSVLESGHGRGELLPYAMEVETPVQLDVRLHLGKTKLLPNETLDIQIAFTSNLECKHSGSYKPCGGRSRVSKCIHKQYFGDGVVNCPYDDCYDEGGCSPSKGEGGDVEVGSVLNTRVMVTAATSIFLSFFLFLGCIWLCRYLELLCWSGGGGGGAAGSGGSAVELEPAVPLPPSAPSDHDPLKDPPPAYDDLFPHGAPASLSLAPNK